MKIKVESKPATSIELLTVAFVCLKLAGEITWSWAWVLSPIWIFGAIEIIIFIFNFIFNEE